MTARLPEAWAHLAATPLLGWTSTVLAWLPADALPASAARTASAGTLANGATAASLVYTAPATATGLTPVELTATYATVGSASNVTVKATVTVAP